MSLLIADWLGQVPAEGWTFERVPEDKLILTPFFVFESVSLSTLGGWKSGIWKGV